MSFSVSSATVDWIAAAVYLVVVVLYAAAVAVAGRRFGARGPWGVWIVGLAAVSLFPVLRHGAPISHLDGLWMFFHTVVLGVPMGISAWVIASTFRRPRPAGVPVQVALGTLAFLLSFLGAVAVFFVMLVTH